jgi:hypothetical protein
MACIHYGNCLFLGHTNDEHALVDIVAFSGIVPMSFPGVVQSPNPFPYDNQPMQQLGFGLAATKEYGPVECESPEKTEE